MACKRCGLPIRWVQDGQRHGKPRWKCLNPDGSDHWDLCSEARTKRVITEGTPFTDDNGSGYIHDGKKKYHHMVARTKFGKRVPNG